MFFGFLTTDLRTYFVYEENKIFSLDIMDTITIMLFPEITLKIGKIFLCVNIKNNELSQTVKTVDDIFNPGEIAHTQSMNSF